MKINNQSLNNKFNNYKNTLNNNSRNPNQVESF